MFSHTKCNRNRKHTLRGVILSARDMITLIRQVIKIIKQPDCLHLQTLSPTYSEFIVGQP